MSSGSSEDVNSKLCLKIMYISFWFKEDLALNNP